MTQNEGEIILNKKQYAQSQDKDLLQLRNTLSSLPDYVSDYFRGISNSTAIKTRKGYAYDLMTFYDYLIYSVLECQAPKDIPLSCINELTSIDIEKYLEYLSHYEEVDGTIRTNSEKGIARKLSSLKKFYTYLHQRQLITNNPTVIIETPKLHRKKIIKLDTGEIAYLLDKIETYGTTLSGQKKRYYEKNKLRDLTIFIVFLGTGIRVSELVNLDLTDIDFRESRLHIIRKGGDEDYVYFNQEVEISLKKYIETNRKGISPLAGHERALFLSTQKRRISVAAVEKMVKNYTSDIIQDKKITPHKLRSSFATSLYQETGDIGIVAETLGHSDVNTTIKHYADAEEGRKRRALSNFRLRE